jgi:hypothetical protein
MHDACKDIDTACTVHAVSLIQHVNYDTAFTMHNIKGNAQFKENIYQNSGYLNKKIS